ncbi:hypothetical protein, unlikely [Trypanosoma brucei brucei TREU927]|uniref:Uncharacterized protein n=1 Tax=Trypanosoma brucei brucei (strain 927/4 GUTat10.1) TaxID=185431 RepID=Q38FQ9_TRYB2|nr:hypothetical protein, unlikely [Trypanosoma brucei brucei TREU927]EAN76361.1 hypothetical protein, unlikely [Trypanosoma brucei brucei TREU927]
MLDDLGVKGLQDLDVSFLYDFTDNLKQYPNHVFRRVDAFPHERSYFVLDSPHTPSPQWLSAPHCMSVRLLFDEHLRVRTSEVSAPFFLNRPPFLPLTLLNDA